LQPETRSFVFDFLLFFTDTCVRSMKELQLSRFSDVNHTKIHSELKYLIIKVKL